MPNPTSPVFVSRRRPGMPGWIRVGHRVLLFAAVLVIACCMTARAAVVEAEGVEREVDTPTGARTQTLDDAAPPPVEEVEAPPSGSTAAAPTPGESRPQNFEPLPVVTETPTAATEAAGGGSSRLLGFVVIGLILVLIGVFIFAARGRGRR